MASRRPDVIRLQTPAGFIAGFESLEVVNDIAGISEAILRFGDDRSWGYLAQLIAPGNEFTVFLNGRPRLKGRVEITEPTAEVSSGATFQLNVRTKKADAHVASAEPVTVQDVSVADFGISLYEQIGLTRADFRFAEFADRDLMTGKAGGAAPPLDFETIKPDQAKVQPPETIADCFERHLRRFRATHWDGPTGEILVGRPDDTQPPLYRLQCKRGPTAKANNVLSCRRILDWSEVPSQVTVYGQTHGRDVASSQFKAVAVNDVVADVAARTGHFRRNVIVQDQQAKSIEEAQRTATRELSARRRRQDAWELTVDGWSYWNGNEQINWANNTTVDIDVEPLGGPVGRFLIVRVQLRLTLDGAAVTVITVVAPGIWVL